MKIGEKEYPAKLKLLAVKEYKKLTGKDLISEVALYEIFGGEKDGVKYSFDVDLLAAFLFSVLRNGDPNGFTMSMDEMCAQVDISGGSLVKELGDIWVEGFTGLSSEEIKNRMAPQTEGQS
jgi:hypothetical protein